MRPAEIPESTIVAAGQELCRNGKPVTGARLRTAIKGGNPARLLRVWESFIAAGGEVPETGLARLGHATPAMGAAAGGPSAASGPDRVAELQSDLERTQSMLTKERQRADQIQLLLNAVTDDMLKFKERCAALDAKETQQRDRIADLTARIQEQSASLNRGEQNRISLQRALEKLTDAAD